MIPAYGCDETKRLQELCPKLQMIEEKEDFITLKHRHYCVEKKEIRCGRFEHCDIREKIGYVGRKLHELGGTLEFFVSCTRENMERYSVIHMNLEILETLDQLLGKMKVKTNRELPFALSGKWRAQDKKIYFAFPRKYGRHRAILYG